MCGLSKSNSTEQAPKLPQISHVNSQLHVPIYPLHGQHSHVQQEPTVAFSRPLSSYMSPIQ